MTKTVQKTSPNPEREYRFLGQAEAMKRKPVCALDPGDFTREQALNYTEEAVQVRIVFKPTATVDQIMSLFQNSNLLALANSGQNGTPAPVQGGSIQIFSTVKTPVRVVDCPTVLTHVKFSLELPDIVGSFHAKSVSRSTLRSNAGGYNYVDSQTNPALARAAIVEVGTFAHKAAQELFRSIGFLFGLGCEYTVFNHPLTVTGLARHNNLRGTGASTSGGLVIAACEEANRNIALAGGDDYLIPSEVSQACGDSQCCNPAVIEPLQLAPINFVEQCFPGDLNGMVPLPICLMVDTADAISCEALILDEASLRRFAELISNEEHELVEGAGTNLIKTVYSERVESFAQTADTLRVGVNACFDPTASSNPPDSYVDITTTTDYLPCDAIATVFSGDPATARGTWRFGAQSRLNGNMVVNSGVAAGTQLSTGPTGVTMAQPRETSLNAGPVLPKLVKVGDLVLVVTLLGWRMSGYSFAAAKFLDMAVNGAPELGVEAPKGLDKKALFSAYSKMKDSKLLRNLPSPYASSDERSKTGVAGIFEDR